CACFITDKRTRSFDAGRQRTSRPRSSASKTTLSAASSGVHRAWTGGRLPGLGPGTTGGPRSSGSGTVSGVVWARTLGEVTAFPPGPVLLLCQDWARFERVEDDACELAFEAADRFATALAFGLLAL